MFRLIACLFISSFFFSSQVFSQNKLANEMIASSNGQKFFEIGACYAVAIKAVEAGNPNLTQNVKKLIGANPELANLKDVANDFATKKCGEKRTESCMRSLPAGVLGFIVGEDKAKTYLKNVNTENAIQNDLVETCKKNFKY
jgi:hypothetical protein